MPRDIVLLMGGGFALATGFKATGLDVWLAGHLGILRDAPTWLMILAICALMTFVTEFTSNIASTTIMIPILAALAQSMQVHLLLLIVPATLSASCAFMLPVATPPNAIAFGSGELDIKDMVRAGIVLNLIGIVLVTAAIYFIGPGAGNFYQESETGALKAQLLEPFGISENAVRGASSAQQPCDCS